MTEFIQQFSFDGKGCPEAPDDLKACFPGLFPAWNILYIPNGCPTKFCIYAKDTILLTGKIWRDGIVMAVKDIEIAKEAI